MSSRLTYEFTNGYLPENHSISNRIPNNKNLNYIYMPSKSPPLYHNLNSISSNTYSSYDTKLSSNNSKTSNVSSSNESSMLNNSYHSTNDDYIEPQYKHDPVHHSNSSYDHTYTNYMVPNEVSSSAKRHIKSKNFPQDKTRLNETILKNKISDYKPSFNPLNKRPSVNIDSFPSTPRSNLSTPPVQDTEKLTSYEYLNNSNNRKVLNKDKSCSDKIVEGSYSMLTGSMNKDKKMKSIINVSGDYNFVAGNLQDVKPDAKETVTNSESPLYRKIMSKLSEIPDSMFVKNSSSSLKTNSPISSNILKENPIWQKSDLSKKISYPFTIHDVKFSDDQKFVSLIDVNQTNKQNYPLFRDNKENKNNKYRSMYFDPKVFDADDRSLKEDTNQTIQKKDKVTSQAGDLIYTSLPFYSSSLSKKTSNPTYDINDYLYSDETNQIGRNLHSKVQDKKKIPNENKKTLGKSEDKTNANGKIKEHNNKNGINAYIKLIDTNQKKNFSKQDDFLIAASNKKNNLSKKNSMDPSYQSDVNSEVEKSKISDDANILDSSYQSNFSNSRKHSLFPEQNLTSRNRTNGYLKLDSSKMLDLNKSIDTVNKTEPKPQPIILNRTKDTEEIEKSANFDQSTSFTDSFSDIDYDFLENSSDIRQKRYKKRRSKNLNIVLSISDKKNITKVISNYSVKSNVQETKINEEKTKSQSQAINKSNKERKLSNEFDLEISDLTKNMDLKVKDKSRLNDSTESKYPVLMRKISTPPPLPHILENKNKRNTIHTNDSIFLSTSKPATGETKPVSLTSTTGDIKTEKPVRFSHGLPPPPQILSPHQINSNLNEKFSKDIKSKDDKLKQNESMIPNKTENSQSVKKKPQLIKNSHVSKASQKDVILKISKKDEKSVTTTNLPQLDKIDYVLKTNDDKLLTNIVPSLDDKRNHRSKREHKKLTKKFYLNEYKLDDEAWSSGSNGKNFYENYAKENDRRKKEGNGFLMLLPEIAIPIDTDAADSDESG